MVSAGAAAFACPNSGRMRGQTIRTPLPEAPIVTNSPAHTLLIGCGQVGAGLASRLTAEGGAAFGLRRSTAALPSHITPIQVDLLDPGAMSLPEADAMVITLTPSIGGPDTPDGYTTALQNLANLLPSVPSRTVMVSSTGIFDTTRESGPLTEADDPTPATARGRRLRDGEDLARDLFGAHIVRPAGIYGAGRGMLLRKVMSGEPVQYARRTNRIHEDDLVSILHAMLTRPEPPAVLHAVDQQPAPLGDVVTFIAEQMDLPAPPRISPEDPSGNTFDGARLHQWHGPLRHPSYQDGYRRIIADRQSRQLRPRHNLT